MWYMRINTLQLKKDRVLLLKAVRDHIKVSIDNADVNSNSEADISDMLLDMKDKKQLKQLKVVKKELDKWIKELE